MAEFSILITSSPFHGDSAMRALAFINGVIANGDKVNNIFFYSDGVYHANSLMLDTGDAFSTYKAWSKLSTEHDVTLLVCITAAVKRGIVSQQEADDNGIGFANLQSPFVQAGLGEFFTSLHSCNNLVQF
jgi:tRNA 2-thiouridine synthesizing protein D